MEAIHHNQQSIETTIDRFGRMLIPQKMRETLHLKPGTKVQISQTTGQEMHLKVLHEEPTIEKKDNWVIVAGKEAPADFDVVGEIKEDREQRDKKIRGTHS